MSQSRKNIRSAKVSVTKNESSLEADSSNSNSKTYEAHVFIAHSSKMCSDQTGKFPHVARSGNQYIMVVFAVDPNVILATAFQNKTKLHLTEAYLRIKKEINKRGFVIKLHILDNEAPEMHRDAIAKECCAYQLVSPHVHRRNAAERATRTFKEHFLRVLAGVDDSFPMSMWDHLLPQTIIALNLLRKSKVHPHLSAWEHCNGLFDCNATPLGPAGCRALIHEKVSQRSSWGFHAKPGFYTGPALNHYRNYTVFASATRAPRPCDTVEFRHSCLTVPHATAEDKVMHAISQLKRELSAIPSPKDNTQLEALSKIKQLFHQCNDNSNPSSNATNPSSSNSKHSIQNNEPSTPRVSSNKNIQSHFDSYELPYSKTPSIHDLNAKVPAEPVLSQAPLQHSPIATRTRSKLQQNAVSQLPSTAIASKHCSVSQLPSNPIASRTRSKFKAYSATELSVSTILHQIKSTLQFSSLPTENTPPMIANAVLDSDSGEMLEHRQLLHHKDSKAQKIWTRSAADEFGRLFQGVSVGSNKGQRIEGTNAFFFIKHSQVPKHKIKDITYARVVCTIRPTKEDAHRTRITVGGNRINYHSDVGTPTAHLETAKLLLNSVLSRSNAKFMTLDLANFYLMTTMEDFEYMRIKIDDIPFNG